MDRPSASPRHSTDVNGPDRHLRADRRHLQRRLHHQCRDRRHHRRRFRPRSTTRVRGSGHSYTVTVQASDGTLSSSQTFAIAVTDVAPSTPVDSNAAANTVAEGAAAGTTVGVTASLDRHQRRALTYCLSATPRVAASPSIPRPASSPSPIPTKIDYESAPGTRLHRHRAGQRRHADELADLHHRRHRRRALDAGRQRPTVNTIAEGAANGSTVGVTASFDRCQRSGRVTYSLIGDTSGGGFTINATTGVVTVADSTKIDYESSPPGTPTPSPSQASDGTLASTQDLRHRGQPTSRRRRRSTATARQHGLRKARRPAAIPG